jgi:hypothetical protein
MKKEIFKLANETIESYAEKEFIRVCRMVEKIKNDRPLIAKNKHVLDYIAEQGNYWLEFLALDPEYRESTSYRFEVKEVKSGDEKSGWYVTYKDLED